MRSSRVTLNEVARQAGVSRTTASFVLTGRTDMRISVDARDRVLAAAAELGYRPNLTARGLRAGVTGTIGLISDTIATAPYAGQVIRGALDAALKHDRLLLVAETGGDPAVERRVAEEMLDRQVDAVLYGSMYTQEREPPATLRDRPVVLLNCLAESSAAPSVVPDEYQAGRTAARTLLNACHASGIYVVGETPDTVFAARERKRGFTEVLTDAGVGLAGTIDCQWWPEHSHRGVSDLVESGRRPRAVICMNDRAALGVYQAAHDHGLRIPDDLTVVSFDDSDLASWLRPTLTSVALPHYLLGSLAATLLLENRLERQVHRVAMPIRLRDSTNPVAARR